MKKQTLGMIIWPLRKGMMQLEFVEKMCVTGKVVSKLEWKLFFLNINSIPKLVEIFDITLKGIGIVMGIAVTVLSFSGELKNDILYK